MTLTNLFSDIANAIREKTGGTAPIPALNFPAAIKAIQGGGISDGIQLVKVNVTCNDEGNYYIGAPIVDENGSLLEVQRQMNNGDTFYTAVSKSERYVEVGFYFEPRNMISFVNDFVITSDDGANGSKVNYFERWTEGPEARYGNISVTDGLTSDTYEITLNLNGTVSG